MNMTLGLIDRAVGLVRRTGVRQSLLAALLWLPVSLVHAFPATQCAADRLGSNLNCSAGDVGITGMAVVGDTTSCVGGTPVTLDLQMTVNFKQPNRYDIGIFLSQDGLPPEVKSASGGATMCNVSSLPAASPFLNLNGNACGDGSSSIGGGTGSGIHYVTNVTIPCTSSASFAGGNLYIPAVVTWDQNASGVCTSSLDLVPGASSKCSVPAGVNSSVAVLVLPSITKTDGKTTLFSGDATSYSVTITNATGVALTGAVFKDPAVSGIAVSGVSCIPAGGATCPVSTVAAMQGAGITIPSMPVNSSVTFTIPATLTGAVSTTLTNTAYVTVGTQTNSASDSNMIVDSIALLPTSQALTGDKAAIVTYTYTLNNYGVTSDTVNLSVASSRGWTVTRSPASVTLAPGASTPVTVTVTIPNNAAVGTVDTTTLTGVSTASSKTVTATAVTTVTDVLTLAPSHTSAGGAGAYVYYSHRVQNNASTAKGVSLTPTLAAIGCTGWLSALYEADKATPLTSPVTLAANGGYKDFMLRIYVPPATAAGTTCTATLTAAYTAGAANTVSVTDVTTVKNLILYEDPGYTTEQSTYPAGNSVYGKSFGLTNGQPYYYRWVAPDGTVMRNSSVTNNLVSLPDTYTIPAVGPFGTWTVQVCNNATIVACTIFTQTQFYVGPDHLRASYAGADPAVNTDVVIDLALHDKFNHVVPFDAQGLLVSGSPVDPEGPLLITVTVSGSAEIVDDPVQTTLSNYTISGQTITGRLSSLTGTAKIVIRSPVAGAVIVTPSSYKGTLYGSPVRDEPATVTFIESLNHIRLEHDGVGVTCSPSTVIVKACADAICATLSSTTTTVTLLPATGWSVNPITFTGSTTLTLSQTTPQTVTLGTSAASPSPSGASPTCFIGASADCAHEFADTGFIFSTSNGGAEAVIPSQTAGLSSSAYVLRAVKKSTGSQACEAALSGAQTISFAYECVDPAVCYAADLMSVNGGTSTVIARNDGGSVTGYTSVNMNFDASGNAPFSFNYGDVGTVKLWANKAAGGSLLSTLTGASNAFVVKPYDFGVVACPTSTAGACTTANSSPTDGTGVVFAKAGEAFKATVTARTATGSTAPSFGGGVNNAVEVVELTHTRVAPVGAGATDGTLGGTRSIARNAFTNGAATVGDLSWSEVGVITLTATNATFQGNALTTAGTGGNVGRFIPHHFDTAVAATATTPMPCPTGLTCPVSYNGFIYSGQPFSLQVTARNLAGGATANYDGAFGLSKAVMLAAWDALGSTTTQNPGGGALANNAIAAADFTAGVATIATPTYTFAAVETAPTNIFMRAADTDSVTSLRAVPADSVEGGVMVASGRIKLSNAHGSELLPLPLTATVQYWNGANWLTSTTDSVTSFNTATDITVNIVKGPLAGVNVTGAGVGAVVGGIRAFTLSKPNVAGSADISLTVPNYLLSGSNGAGVNPSKPGRATFGVYKSNKEFIYMRENY